MARMTSAALAHLARQASIDAVRTHAQKWWFASVLPRVSRGKSPVLHLKRLRTEMVLQYGAAPSSAAYQATALLLSYRRGNGDPGGSCNLSIAV